VRIEIYPNHDDLAVRTAGLPGLGGELGVTFGYIVAIDSPGARPVGQFHWGDTLWHEMAHVYTLESTDFHVPRWLTEGLSVFEEWRTGPSGGEQIPAYVLADLARGRALPVARLNGGFVHPQYPNQLLVSYMQAGLICDYIDRSFGFERLRALLQAFAHTSDVSAAMQAALGISATQLDARFAADLQQRKGVLFAQMDRWLSLRTQAERAAARQDWHAAQAAASAALALEAQDVADDSPYLPLASAYQGQGEGAQALQTLLAYWHRGGHDPQALRSLATALYAAGRMPEAIQALDAINYIAPFDESLHGQLGDWLLQAARPAEALTEYRVALALDPPDLATAHLRLARAELALHALPEARREVFAALEVAPNFRPAQQLLLQLSQQSTAY
jgi:cellulose synthase operon protein C